MRQKEENIIKDGTKSFPIRNQMVMMFFIVILPLFAASVMLLVNMRTIIKDQTLSSTVSSSNSIRYRTMDMVESTDSIMRMFAGSGELKSFLEKRSSEKSEYYDFYAKNIHVQYVQASPQVSNIYVFINRNEFVYNSNYIYADESVLTQKWYNSAAQDPSTAVWDIIKSPTDGMYYLGCAQAITDTSNETVTAVAVAVISDEWLMRVMPDEHIRTVMCVGGKAFFSDFAEIVKGDSVSGDNDLNVKDISKNPKSLALRTHSQTSGWSLTEQDPFNNVGRTCIEAMGAALGHTQSLHTNALDEAIALPTDFSARIARNTQIYIQEETKVCKEIDPWAGSYYVESLTNEIAHRAWEHIQEIEKLGGMAKAIETGLPKLRIEEAAARTQARIDSGRQTIVGINKYRLDHEDPIDILEIDNTEVRNEQVARLVELRKDRDEEAVKKALAAITECVRTGEGNLLDLAVKAAGVRASLGEISDACEEVVGRYKAVIRTISGVYSNETKNDPDFLRARKMVEEFAKREGRQPRIMIAKMGQDGHDRGAKVVATGYADCGFDVDMGPLFQTPAEAARQAVENDVHILGVSSLAAGHKTLIPQVIEELKKLGRDDIMVTAGGVIPAQDYDFLYRAGVAAIFGPGTRIPASAIRMLEILEGE